MDEWGDAPMRCIRCDARWVTKVQYHPLCDVCWREVCHEIYYAMNRVLGDKPYERDD